MESGTVENTEEPTFKVEIAKTVAISAATTAGMLAGIAVFATLKSQFDKFKTRKETKSTK